MMTKHCTTMRRAQEQPFQDVVAFDNSDGDPDVTYEQYLMRLDNWDEMGKPEQITVSVEPGDTLNKPIVSWSLCWCVPGSPDLPVTSPHAKNERCSR